MQWLIDLVRTKILREFQGRLSKYSEEKSVVVTRLAKHIQLNFPELETVGGWKSLQEASHVLGPLLLSFKDLLMATAEERKL